MNSLLLSGHRPEDWGKRNMTRRALVACSVHSSSPSARRVWAAEDEKRIINGPSKTSFGGLELVLGQGASAETAFQPDSSKLIVKTLVGEARVVTSAKNLILVESTEGRVEILLPNGRVIVVEPGKAEIVGRALVDDPGNITIRLSGTGPIAQGRAGGRPRRLCSPRQPCRDSAHRDPAAPLLDSATSTNANSIATPPCAAPPRAPASSHGRPEELGPSTRN